VNLSYVGRLEGYAVKVYSPTPSLSLVPAVVAVAVVMVSKSSEDQCYINTVDCPQ
jgi:hypothetical protein